MDFGAGGSPVVGLLYAKTIAAGEAHPSTIVQSAAGPEKKLNEPIADLGEKAMCTVVFDAQGRPFQAGLLVQRGTAGLNFVWDALEPNRVSCATLVQLGREINARIP